MAVESTHLRKRSYQEQNVLCQRHGITTLSGIQSYSVDVPAQPVGSIKRVILPVGKTRICADLAQQLSL